jgi:dienelactone hydrolase
MNLHLLPKLSLIDEKVEWFVDGLTPGMEVTIHAKDVEANLESSAFFVADREGKVDPAQQKPVHGSYDWVDPMGLIWTMAPRDPGNQSMNRLGFQEMPQHVIFIAQQKDKPDASQTIQRSWLKEGVARIPVHEEGLHGVLFMPTGIGPFPGIMILTGSGGGANERTAALWANHGYAAFALAYFAYEGCPDYLIEIPLEYFEKGFQWLAKNPRVDGSRLAVSGGSRGGELSLLLGATFPMIKAVIAYVPSSVTWGGFGGENADLKASWTYQGKDLVFIKGGEEIDTKAIYGNNPIPLTPGFLKCMELEDEVEASTIPVEKIQGAVMLISGEDDQMWPSTLFSNRVMDRLKKFNFPHPYEHLSYPQAGHAISIPYIPLSPRLFIQSTSSYMILAVNRNSRHMPTKIPGKRLKLS